MTGIMWVGNRYINGVHYYYTTEIMPEEAKKVYSDSSNNSTKSLHPVDSTILGALRESPRKASELKKMLTSGPRPVSVAQYFKRLRGLRDSDPPKIAFVSVGREKVYALYENRDQLAKYARRRGKLEQFVVENAYRMAEKFLTLEVAEEELAARSSMLSIAVEALRTLYSELPKPPSGCGSIYALNSWIRRGRYDSRRDRKPSATRRAENWREWIDTEAGQLEIMRQVWYLYWIEVLQFFREF
jgi:hypothetical protein